MLGLTAAQHASRNWTRLCTDSLDVWLADHGQRHAGDAFGEHNVGLARADDRPLVVVVRTALGGRDESRAELCAGIPHPQGCDEAHLVADPARADNRHAEPRELIVERLRAARARMAAGAIVDGDEPVHAPCQPLLGPLPLGYVVVDDAALGGDAIHDPARIA